MSREFLIPFSSLSLPLGARYNCKASLIVTKFIPKINPTAAAAAAAQAWDLPSASSSLTGTKLSP
ncbi:MAG: hypothetical protein A2746_01735 [Candidatus Yanofskybacteria bacterium RIFCSPHIGHO2_01_FULL_44_22]|uniref:Uncharacterized protein n=1 Tax=Candidatus Yanofskybacteria bacterium RIFCSPHIGHO2_01_FULL_44_22 TaxID=1802669 RepID=A0A1F8ETD9_9BACT|nr:MAG: hypothetical protein A2746_01735 [Candidatus Yanofskybacteria bacterium RIFCSPHIGHO2_01_FULL_44_22]